MRCATRRPRWSRQSAASDKPPEAIPQAVAAPQPEASQSTAHTFDLLELQVEGNTLLDRVRVERAVYPFLGEGKTVKDVEAARQALEIVYRDSGYATVVVDIPEQDGAVLLVVG